MGDGMAHAYVLITTGRFEGHWLHDPACCWCRTGEHTHQGPCKDANGEHALVTQQEWRKL